MTECIYTIKSAYGLHARPAGQLVRLVKPYASTVTMLLGENSCDMRRLMALMAMGVKQGDTITIRAEGEDEAACIAELSRFLAENV